MEKEDLKEYIESGDYFKDARNWYNWKYILPMTHRVWLFYIFLLSFIMLITLGVNINNLLPIKQKLTYAINVSSDVEKGETKAKVLEMDKLYGTPTRFIANNLLANYVMKREEFNYEELDGQVEYVQKNSSRLTFKRFYNYMNVNNPESPVMRYQQYATRKIQITDMKFITDTNVVVSFNSVAKDSSNKAFENLKWEANIRFDMGEVGKRLNSGSKFKFIVTDYNLKLLGEAR
jgi:type IV secretion system protein VirB8